MREILFRGRDVKRDVWEYGDLLRNANGKSFIHKEYEGIDIFIEVYPETVGQYTGLTDLNEKEIFEGDILKKPNNELTEVVWCEENACFCGSWWDRADGFYECLVVGNRWDNPKLLKEIYN